MDRGRVIQHRVHDSPLGFDLILAREEGRDGSRKGESKNDRDLGHAFKQVFGQAAPQKAKYKYTTFKGISQ